MIESQNQAKENQTKSKQKQIKTPPPHTHPLTERPVCVTIQKDQLDGRDAETIKISKQEEREPRWGLVPARVSI